MILYTYKEGTRRRLRSITLWMWIGNHNGWRCLIISLYNIMPKTCGCTQDHLSWRFAITLFYKTAKRITHMPSNMRNIYIKYSVQTCIHQYPHIIELLIQSWKMVYVLWYLLWVSYIHKEAYISKCQMELQYVNRGFISFHE